MEFKQKNTRLLFVIFILIFLLVYIFASPFLQLKSYNLLNKITINNKISSDNIVLITIDDKSLYEIGRWPWKREYYLEIFDYIENHTNAVLMGYDGLITAPDSEHPKSDKKFFLNIGKFKKLTAGYVFSKDNFEKEIDADKYDSMLKAKNDIKIIDKRSKKHSQNDTFKSFTVLQSKYFTNVLSLGSVNVYEDFDGYVRKTPQLFEYKGNLYPSLALVMYSKYTGIKEFVLTDKYLYGFSQKHTLRIPIESLDGMIYNYICYYKTNDGVYSHKKYSASDVILSYRALKQGKKPVIESSVFDNKIVFIGANAQAQALADIIRTPVSETFSGLDLQATNLNNLITNNFFKITNPLYNFLICCFVFVIIFAVVNSLNIVGALLATIFIMLGFLVFSVFMYYNKMAIGVILPELFILVALGCAYSYKYLIEDNKKIKMQKAMGKYLSYDVMQNVVKNIDNISLGGKRADITVLFADIRNFTSISESMDANSVTMILNEYFSALVPIIEEHNGVLNKFMGDAILAIFGEPKKSENHALDAIICASKMLKKVKYLQEKWIDEGKPKIEIGIGISSGEAFIGNIGSQERLEYTVIGDTVNTASRIENFNKVYKTNFLISETTYERVRDYVDTITIKNVTIRGKANKINLYEVIRLVE